MDPIVIVVIVAVVIGIAAFVALRGRADRTLQKPKEHEKLPPKREKAPPPAKPAAKKKEPVPAERGQKDAAAEALGAEEPAADRVPAAEAPAAREPVEPPSAEPAAEQRASTEPSEDEVEELKKGLKSTRGGFIARLAKLFGNKKEIDPELLEQIEEVLITADLGVKTTDKILGRLRERLEKNELSDEDRIWKAIREEAMEILGNTPGGLTIAKQPTAVLVVGVNGVGKTTTIGKLADRFHSAGKKVVLGAGDTFRAAAVLQLEVWGRRVGCEVVRGKERADPGSVIFDTIKRGQDEGADLVIADTAGRLHTKTPLMDELKKVHRTAEKALGRPADEVLLVLDSTNGQNAIQQAAMFKEALPITGIVLTKLDGTAKGGVILGIVDEHRIPVRYIGIGERVEDLREFDPASFVAALFQKPDDESMAA